MNSASLSRQILQSSCSGIDLLLVTDVPEVVVTDLMGVGFLGSPAAGGTLLGACSKVGGF
jgi:hypothetical protein